MEYLEIKTTIYKMKNTLETINNLLDTIKKWSVNLKTQQ